MVHVLIYIIKFVNLVLIVSGLRRNYFISIRSYSFSLDEAFRYFSHFQVHPLQYLQRSLYLYIATSRMILEIDLTMIGQAKGYIQSKIYSSFSVNTDNVIIKFTKLIT